MKALPFGQWSTRPTTQAQKDARFFAQIERDAEAGLPPPPIAPKQLTASDRKIRESLEREMARKDRLREYGIRYRARKKAETASKPPASP